MFLLLGVGHQCGFHVLETLDGGYLVNDWPEQPSFARHIDSLTAAGKIPEIIAVGIANVNRIRDFNPTSVKNYPTSGGADKFLNFFYNELIPFMDKNYKTSGVRLLYGHSAGGLLAVYSMLSNPEIFQCLIAASPALSWDNDYPVKLAERKLPEMKLSQNIYLYMSLGEKDYPRFTGAVKRFEALLKQSRQERLDWDFEVFPGLDHAKAAHRGFVDGIQACFSK